MKKKFLIPFTLSLLLTAVFPLAVFAANPNDEPSNDTEKKIELSTSASDNLTASENIVYAWFYLDESGDAPQEIRLSGTEDEPYVKGLSQIEITYSSHGNGVYIARCADESGNSAEERIEVKGWDLTAPSQPEYSISETDDFTKVNEVVIVDANDDVKLADEPFKLSEVTALEGYTYVSEGTFSTQNSFSIRKNGFYELKVRDYAGNETARTFEISNIDNTPPVYEGLTLANDGGTLKATVSASDSEEETSKLKYCISPTYSAIDANNASIWSDSPIITKDVNGNDLSDLTGGATSNNCYVGILDEAGNITISTAKIYADYVMGRLQASDVLKIDYESVPAVWSNLSVSLKASAKNSGIIFVRYQFGDAEWQTEPVKAFTDNATVVVKAEDEYGNIYTAAGFHINCIDKADPVLSVTYANINHNAWNVDATDQGAGIKSISLTDGEGNTSQLYSGTVESIPASTSTSVPSSETALRNVPVPALGDYVFTIEDYAGNITTVNKTITDAVVGKAIFNNIDDYIYVTPTTWTNGSVSVRLGTLPAAALEDIGYHHDGEVTDKNYALVGKDADPADDSVAWQASPNFSVNANGEYYYCIKTRYGEIIKSSLINITNVDQVKPTIARAELNSKGNKISITAEDALSGVKKITVQGGTYTEATVIKDAGTSILPSMATSFEVPVSNTTYIFTVYDNAGNVETRSVAVGNAQTDNDDLTAENLASRLIQSPAAGTWTNGNVTLTLALTSTAGLADAPYSWDDGATWTTSRSHVFTDNGTYSVKVKDSYGNIITSNGHAIGNIDKTVPAVTASANAKKNLITITASDALSKLSRITVTAAGGTETTIADYASGKASATETFNVPANDTYTFKAYDRAGNYSVSVVDITSATTNNEELAPDVLKSLIMVSPSGWTNGNVKLKLTLNSTEGLSTAPYKWTGQSAFNSSNELVVTENGLYTVTVKDLYGNEITSNHVSVSKIDKILPTLNATANESGNTLTISASDEDSKMQKITVVGGPYSEETTIKDTGGSTIVPSIASYWRVPLSNTTYTVRAYDNAGNVSEKEVTIGTATTNNTDLSPAVLRSRLMKSPAGWTNGNVELTLALSDTSELDATPYSWDDGTSWTAIRSHVYSENGTVHVKVKDAYGNVFTSNDYEIANIDKVLPVISAHANDKQNAVTISVADHESKLARITVTAPGATEETLADYSTITAETREETYTVPENGTYVFKVYDKAGNMVSATVEINAAETDNAELTPDVLLSRIIKTPTTWTNGNVKLKLALNSTDGLADAPFKWTGQDVFGTVNEVYATGNGTYTVIVKDAYGNEIESSAIVVDNIDRIKPVITYHANDNSNQLLISATDEHSKMQKITIEGGTYTEETTIRDAGGSDSIATIAVDWKVPLSNTTYVIRAYDIAGNVRAEEVTIGVVTTDNEDLTPAALQSNIVQMPTGWTNQNVVLTLALSNTADLDALPYSWDDGETWTTSRSSVVTENGSYSVKVKDKYGNIITSNAYTVSNIDKTLPTILTDLNDSGNKVTISVTEEASKLQKITVIAPAAEEETIYDLSAQDKYEDSVEYIVPANGEYTFAVYDRAGNKATSVVIVDGAITDNAELNATTIAGRVLKTPATWTNGTVNLKLALNSTSGLAEVPYKWTGQVYGTSNEINVAENGEYHLTIKDAYGNEIESDPIIVDYIDTTAPEFTVELNDQHNNLILSLTDNASGLRKVTISGGTYTEEVIIKEFATSTLTGTASIPIPALGDYTVKAYDNAGNVSAALVQIAEAYTDNPELDPAIITSRIVVENDGWTNKSLTLSLDLRSLRGLADQPYYWSNADGYSTSNKTIVTENGTYYVTVKDKYGNEFRSGNINVATIDKALPTSTVTLSDDGTTVTIRSTDENSGIARILWESTVLGGLASIKEYAVPVRESGVTVAIPNVGDYSIYVYDAAGNKVTIPLHVESISAPNPLLSPVGIRTSIRKSPYKWTNGDVTLAVDMADTTGVAADGYIWESTAPTDANYLNGAGSHTTLVVKGNGVVNLTVTDVYGQTFRSEDVEVDNIDKTAPTVSVNKDTNSILVTASDTQSGIEKIVCKLVGGSEEDVLARSFSNFMAEANASFPFSKNGTYELTAYDNAGNTAVDTIEITDARANNAELTPEGISRAISKSTTSATNQPVVLECNLMSTYGLADQPYSWDGGNTWSDSSRHTVSENGIYTLSVKDFYGNVIEGTVSVDNIDKVDPQLTATFKDKKVHLKASDQDPAAGLRGEPANRIDRIMAKSPSSAYEIIVYDRTKASNETGSEVEMVFEPTDNGTWTFTAYDIAGNSVAKNVNVSGLPEKTSGEATPAPVITIPEEIDAAVVGGNDTTTTASKNNQSSQTERLREEYHYNTTKETPMYIKGSATPVTNRTVVQPTPAPIIKTPTPVITPTPTPVADPVVKAPVTSSAKKVTSSNATTTTTVAKATNQVTAKVVDTSVVSEQTEEEPSITAAGDSVDAREMYRNTRIEGEPEQATAPTSKKPLLIMLGVILGLALIGGLVYMIVRIREKKRYRYDRDDDGEDEQSEA